MDSNERDRTADRALGPRSAFVVHVHPESVTSSAETRGRIEHVPTGLNIDFTGFGQMLAFIRRALGVGGEESRTATGAGVEGAAAFDRKNESAG